MMTVAHGLPHPAHIHKPPSETHGTETTLLLVGPQMTSISIGEPRIKNCPSSGHTHQTAALGQDMMSSPHSHFIFSTDVVMATAVYKTLVNPSYILVMIRLACWTKRCPSHQYVHIQICRASSVSKLNMSYQMSIECPPYMDPVIQSCGRASQCITTDDAMSSHKDLSV
ncbi:hypothetical protein N7520_010865 [Penicillium odoratum]|uniref:uncharacterized protein n=1 Tax=Penicillium odoratum TaxID=1167516 RepID=UPI0025493E88|nr:uncharacterized protein N7520_010865 [Penicillium odoratum]KAJ5745683.1 hypothetical protein N7520_010865 [Penicillium odoratum]